MFAWRVRLKTKVIAIEMANINFIKLGNVLAIGGRNTHTLRNLLTT